MLWILQPYEPGTVPYLIDDGRSGEPTANIVRCPFSALASTSGLGRFKRASEHTRACWLLYDVRVRKGRNVKCDEDAVLGPPPY